MILKSVRRPKEPRAYRHGGYGNTLPKIEEALEGHVPGFQTTLWLAPEDAFGSRDEELMLTSAAS